MKLHLGPGPGPRLLAPGVPDWIGADGTRVGWVLRDRLFLHGAEGVQVVSLPDLVEDVVAAADGWVCALGAGFVRVDPAAARVELALLDDEADPVTTRAGRDAVLFVEVPEHRLLTLRDGTPLPLPDAATRARFLRPWATGLGACWVDFDTLYRMGARISALGRAPEPEGLATGPEGAVAVALKADTVVAAPRGLTVRVGRRLDLDGARFSPDGASLLAADEDGVVLVDLTTGTVGRTWEGRLAPVGWAPGVVLWDLDRGTLVDAEGRVLLEGLAGGVAACAPPLLVGPGGAVWDLPTGGRVRAGLVDEVYATDGRRVVGADGTGFGLLDGPRHAHTLATDEDPLAGARLDGDVLELRTLDGERGRFQLGDGAAAGRAPPRRSPAGRRLPAGIRPDAEEGSVTVDGTPHPLPVDGAAREGSTVWLWNDEGMLVLLPTAGATVS